MALVLAVRPQGLMGELAGAAPREKVTPFQWGGDNQFFKWIGWMVLAASGIALITAGEYTQSVLENVLIMMLFGLSLQWMMALSGWVSFGHAAYFGLGAYAAALSHLHWHFNAIMAAMAGVVAAFLAALCMGKLLQRSTGVYLAMLSLAFAQMVWATASQWVSFTGGDNGLIGLQFFDGMSRWIFQLVLILLCFVTLFGFSRLIRSSFGAALQAGRDAPQRAQASALNVANLNQRVFLMSAGLAGLSGALWAISKGAVFPSVASVSNSVDALMVVLLGGVHQLWGAFAGSLFLVGVGSEIGRYFEYWRGSLGLLIMLLMVFAPEGILGLRKFEKHASSRAL
jgi:branched-chain amino acid transport system permease protein